MKDMKTTTIFIALLLSVFILGSCDDGGIQSQEDARLIEDYIAENELDAESTASGLYYVIDEPGNDEHPEIGDMIDIVYTGFFLNGEIFDSSNGVAVPVPLNTVIQGWREGIPLFGKGGKGMLLIPSHLAYGTTGSESGAILPNTVILFDIELDDFN